MLILEKVQAKCLMLVFFYEKKIKTQLHENMAGSNLGSVNQKMNEKKEVQNSESFTEQI